MSLENVEAVRRFFAARNQGDIEAMLAATAEEIEVDYTRSRAPWAGLYRGHDSVREAWQRLADAFEATGWEIEDLIDAGDAVIAISRFHTRGRGSGVESVAGSAQVYWFENGKVVRFMQCQDRAEAMEAIGLSA